MLGQAVDELQNRRLAGGDSFMVWLEGPTTVHATVADNKDGTYTATYNTTMSGIYDVYITNGAALLSSPLLQRICATSCTGFWVRSHRGF